MLRVCLVLIILCVFGAGHMSGRGLFCRDPETGKLHPVNSSWTATSFCGTYHCKIRRKNITSNVYAPMRQLNVTDVRLKLPKENDTTEIMQKDKKQEVVKNTVSTDNKTIPYTTDNDVLKNIQGIKLNVDIDEKNASDKDRYLSDKEIRSLTEILHTVKKGDLDAIVEIYNLAQDLYKQLDQTSTDLILQEALSTAKTFEQQKGQSKGFKKLTKQDSASYWYEPLSNTKIRVADLSSPDIIRNYVNPEIPAMVISIKAPADKVGNMTSKPKTKTLPVQISPPLSAGKPAKKNNRKESDEYFNIPLTHKDFGKLPYYYPMSNFQRVSSYKHDQQKNLLDNTRTKVTLSPILTTTLAPMPLRVTNHLPEWIPKSLRTQTEAQISESLPAQKQNSMPVRTQAQIPESKPARKQKPIPARKHVQISESIPAWISEPFPPQVLESKPARIQKSMAAQTQLQIRDSIPAWISQSLPAQTQAQIPESIPARIHEPVPKQTQAHVLARIAARLPAPKPVRLPSQTAPLRTTTSVPAPAPTPKAAHKSLKNKPMNTGIKYVKELKPLIYVPYPFSNLQQQNDWSLKQSLYNENHFNPLQMRRTNENSLKNIQTITKDEKSNEIPSKKRRKEKQANAVLMNPDLENFQDLQIRASINSENAVAANNKQKEGKTERRKPAWQTDPIPELIIDEVRAHIQEKHRTFIHTVPFRKKVRLERVGNLFNLDQLTRTKREAEDKNTTTAEVQLEPEIFEVFIDKTTCDSDYTVPGYFRFGNLSEPYPECCPQRISV